MVNQSPPHYGKYCRALPNPPIFNEKAYESNDWFYPVWAKVPEEVIAVTREGLETLIEKSGLKIIQKYPGKWKEIPGLYLQDVFILEK